MTAERDEVDRAAALDAGGQSADAVAVQLEIAPSTVRRALNDASIVQRSGGRPRPAFICSELDT